MQIINGRKISEEIMQGIKKEVEALPFVPVFCDVLVGEDPSSLQYVKMKSRLAESVGIKFHNANFPPSITTEDLIKEIKVLNEMQDMCGIIVQLPLPAHLDRQIILDAIDPTLDVDCLGTVSSEKFYEGENVSGLPTALACMAMLETLPVDLKDKNIVVMGQGALVGRPVTALLRFKNLFPYAVTSETEGKEIILKNADVIISGIGKGKYIKSDMIKEGVIIIDAGTSEEGGGIVGDVDLDSVSSFASYVSPVPGGVGPVTVAMLLKNVLQVAKTKTD
ncbi:MAG: bifunctional 5,10-methylenetetrahydrofolate dehydrogenase/5,10-methenyltetrahydrofolate cyclohydrolase [Patescibacteria group bacterium]